MRPAFLTTTKSLIHRRVVGDQHSLEFIFIQQCRQSLAVLVAAKYRDASRLGKRRPDGIDAPARLVRMHDCRGRQQVAQRFKLRQPLSCQSIQHRVRLGLSQLQSPEKFDLSNRLVERQANNVMLVGQRDADLRTEFAAAGHAWNLRHRAVRACINVIRNQHSRTIDNSPHRSRISQPTFFELELLRLDLFFQSGFGQLFVGADTSLSL